LAIGGLAIPTESASAEITLPPKGVSQELWKAFQEVVIKNISSDDRNLRWNTNPSFYISGNPTAADNNTFQGTLAEIRKYCTNIQPNLTTSEPFEGVILKYLPRLDFKKIIPETPESATTSYASYLYYLNRGLTKYTATISTEVTQSQRDIDTQIRMYQGFGLFGYTKNLKSSMFSWIFPSAGVITASELDKQILRLYCSSYSRSWDTSQQTFDAITSSWTKIINIPSINLNVKVGEYKNQLNFGFNFDPSQALDNQLTGIQYTIYDSAGSVATSGKVDVSANLFKSYEVVFSGIKDNSRYKIEAYPINSNGNGAISKGEGRAGTQAPPTDSAGNNPSDASAELQDAKNAAEDATNAAKEAISAFQTAKRECVTVSADFELSEQELFDSTNLISACEQLNEQAALLRAKILALDPKKATSIDQANKITSEANTYAENSDTLVAEIQDITDELAATEKNFSRIYLSLEPLNNLETAVIEPWNSLQERLRILPSSFVMNLKKNTNFKSASLYANQIQVLIKARDVQIEALSSIEKPSQIAPISNKLATIKVTTTQLGLFKKSLSAIDKLIPASVCQRGSAVVLASKSGKCAKGFEAIPTS
jgi:predicted  nucleic acid-binding Zn-ribbon protein